MSLHLHAFAYTVKQLADRKSEEVWTQPKPVSGFLLASQGWLGLQLRQETSTSDIAVYPAAAGRRETEA